MAFAFTVPADAAIFGRIRNRKLLSQASQKQSFAEVLQNKCS